MTAWAVESVIATFGPILAAHLLDGRVCIRPALAAAWYRCGRCTMAPQLAPVDQITESHLLAVGLFSY